MRIAEISAFSDYSVGKIMRDIKKQIDQDGNDECKIFYARGPKKKDSGFIKFGSNARITLKALGARFFDNDGFSNRLNTKRLLSLLNDYSPDIVHIHCLHGYYINIKLLFRYLKNKKNIRVVWTMHDTWAFTGHCCYFSRAHCEKWKKQCFKCQMKKEYPKSFLLDSSRKNYNVKKTIFTELEKERMTITAPSLWMANLLKESFLSKYKVLVIKNGIDFQLFNREICYSSNISCFAKKSLLCVASVWDERKGLDDIIRLSKVTPKEWVIVVVGDVPKNHLPKNIIHIQRTNNFKQLCELYCSANIFFNPTKDEVFGMVNVEAQACGAKVLCRNVGGTPETQIGNLYLFDEFDPCLVWERILEIDSKPLNPINDIECSSKNMALEFMAAFKSESF